MLRFRQLRAEDAAPQLWEQAALGKLLSPENTPAAMLERGSTVYVLYDGELPAGILSVAKAPTATKPVCGVVETVAVLEQYRRHGFGRILMGIAANLLAERRIWFLAGNVPADETAEKFASAIGLKPAESLSGMWMLDLSDVSGLRYG